jgi:TatD DNase family protein
MEQKNTVLIDSHCHLDMSAFDKDRSETVERAKQAGVELMINIGNDIDSCRRGIALAAHYNGVYTTLGVHPHYANTVSHETINEITRLADNPSVVAIGETGLDYHYMNSPKETQINAFRQHLETAISLKLPVVIHSREAESDTMNILSEYVLPRQGALHCFSGSLEMAKRALNMGFFISFSGTVTYKKATQLRDIAAFIPDDSLLIETDAPYLSPEPKRGRRNEPSFLVYTAQQMAELKKVSLEDIARITLKNAKELFHIGSLPTEGEIVYQIRDSLYINLTAQCTNDCAFCTKYQSDYVKGHYLKLVKDPSVEAIIGQIGNPTDYKEVVFCGLGEPFLRLDALKAVAKWIKDRNGRVRINTNGQGNLIYGRNVLPEIASLVDSISISLDAENEDNYNRICRPTLPNAYREVLSFIKQAVQSIRDVEVSVVQTPLVDVAKCQALAEELKVRLRVRQLNVVG